MKELKKYVISLAGQTYSVLSDEPQEHIDAASEKASSLITLVQEKSGHEYGKAAALAAFKYASDLLAHEEQSQKLEQDIQNIIQVIDAELGA